MTPERITILPRATDYLVTVTLQPALHRIPRRGSRNDVLRQTAAVIGELEVNWLPQVLDRIGSGLFHKGIGVPRREIYGPRGSRPGTFVDRSVYHCDGGIWNRVITDAAGLAVSAQAILPRAPSDRSLQKALESYMAACPSIVRRVTLIHTDANYQ